METKPKLSCNENAKTETDSIMRFSNSLQDLRDLHSQLHYAADYCETTFLNVKDKRDVMESTKEYICRALVTVVDHLGSVSTNLDTLVSGTCAFAGAEFRINGLKQRLLSCEQYAHKVTLTRMRWSENLPKFHSRYLLRLTSEKTSRGDVRKFENATPITRDNHALETGKDVPLYIYTCTDPKPSLAKSSSSKTSALEVIPVRDGLSVLKKGPTPTFHFQGTPVARVRKSLHSGDILSIIRRTKRNYLS